MIIRKEFRVESAHIVRNCTSHRCSHSIHGHSAVIELFFESNRLDNAQMVMDFGLMKSAIKEFIDSMDHCYLLCSMDREDFKRFIIEECDRYIIMPFNPSAEMLSTFILGGVNQILKSTVFNNGEGDVRCVKCNYWETTSGYASASIEDVDNFLRPDFMKYIEFSDGVIRDWGDDLKKCLILKECITNPTIEEQIYLKAENDGEFEGYVTPSAAIGGRYE